VTLSQINALSLNDFVDQIGWVFEHSPWVARRAWKHRPFRSLDDLHTRLTAEVACASTNEKLALLRAHPDLGTRAKVSQSSAKEQAGVGLDQLTPVEFARLHQSNEAYKTKFGFPFLYAVKGSDKQRIMQAVDARLQSTPDEEFQEALRQVYRIARFRLEEIIGRSL
jgi:2-oxo-4-hydroxy-4-carboxy-5-ureidoimidazoline decarboxylase